MRFLIIAFVTLAAAAACGSSSDTTSDSRKQADAYARDDIACTTVDDCCVVFDACRAQGLVVGAKDKVKVASLLASAPDEACVKCIPPAVDVRCVSGKCTGVVMQPPSGGDPLSVPQATQDHCGQVTFPSGWSEKPQSLPGEVGPGLSSQTILGC